MDELDERFAALDAKREVAVESGDPEAIKRLYVELGDYFDAAYGDAVESVPVLSLPETQPVVTRLLDGTTGTLLDAGCGPNPAIAISMAAGAGSVVVGLDIGFGTVRLARHVAESHGVGLLGVVADVERLPFRENAFDGIVCDDTIEHLPDDRRGVDELARVARRGARVVLATPNRHNVEIVLRKLSDRLRGRRRPDPHYYVVNSHLREYTWAEFSRLVRPFFRIRRRAPVGWRGGWKRRIASALVRVPAFRRFDQMVVMEVQKR